MKTLRNREARYLPRVTQLIMMESALESSKPGSGGLILSSRHVASVMQGYDEALCVVFPGSIFDSLSSIQFSPFYYHINAVMYMRVIVCVCVITFGNNTVKV